MLTQNDIYAPDGRDFPVKNKPIQIMSPEPGNGWGCIPSVDLVRMLRSLAEKQGKAVTVREVKPEGRVMRMVGKVLLLSGSVYFLAHVAAWWAKG